MTAAMQLFEEGKRVDAAPARPTESQFEFYDRIAGAFWDRIRTLANRLVADYPPGDRAEFIASMKGTNAQFESGWWELLLHGFLRSQGANITIHPEVPGSRKRPDFLVRDLPGGPFYLEAKLLLDEAEESVRDARFYEIWHAVNERLDTRDVMLGFEVLKEGHVTPPVTKLVATLNGWLSMLRQGAPPGDGFHQWDDPASGWSLEFEAIKSIAPSARPVSIGPARFGWQRSSSPSLRKAVESKYRRYGASLDLPMLVAVHTRRDGGRQPFDDEIDEMLFGDQLPPSRAQDQVRRRSNGIWVAGMSNSGGRLTGLLIGRYAMPMHLARTTLSLWKNPSPLNPHPLAIKAVRPIVNTDSEPLADVETTFGSVLHQLGLPEDWPGPDPAFPRQRPPTPT